MATVLYLHLDAAASPVDDTFIARLAGALGHSVTEKQTSTFVTADEVGIDVIYYGNSNGNGVPLPPDLAATTVPLVVAGGISVADEFGFAGGGSTRGGEALEITDAGNVLSAGLPLGVYNQLISNENIAFLSTGGLAPDIKVSSISATSSGYTAFCYLDAGDTGTNALVIPSNRVFIPARSSVDLSKFTANGLLQYDAAIAYAVGVATVPKLEGTLTPWDTQTPVANLTGVKFSVRSDLQTSDNQVLSGTMTTNANGEFTIQNAALGPATSYYVSVENAAGTVVATHKITTD